MSEPKLISPMLDGFSMGDPFSEHHGVRCCPAIKNDADDRYLVKIISIPASQVHLDASLLVGQYSSVDEAKADYKLRAQEVASEIEVLQKLSEAEGFLPIEQYQIESMDDGKTGFDVYLLCRYRRTLERQFRREIMTHLRAVNLGLDICSALSVCRREGYLYVNLKPSNIHVVNDQEYRISDLGFVKLNSLKYASLPDKYRSAYTAPEITDAYSSINATVDIYALGLILYCAYNGGKLPFTGEIAPAEKFPSPEYADYEMAEIILKACDPDPAQRWQDPMQMGQALVSYMQRNGANDTPIIPPVMESATIPEQADDPVDESSESAIETTPEIPENDEPEMDAVTVENTENQITEDIEPQEEISADSVVYSEDDFGNLSFLDNADDETTQELNAEEIEYEEISEEVSEILAQVDEIATHQVPEPVAAPTPSIIAVENLLNIESDQNAEVAEDTSNEDQEDHTDAETPATDLPEESLDNISAESALDETQIYEAVETSGDSTAEPIDVDRADEDPDGEDPDGEDPDGEDPDGEDPDGEDPDDTHFDYEEPDLPKKHTLRNIILILIGLALIALAVLFYNFYYLQRIHAMTVTGGESSVTVFIESQIEESKLNVVCADVYGTKTTSAVVNGQATFPNLLGGTEYTLTVTMDGFHKVVGDFKKTYYTPSVTNIVQLSAVTGSENGSAIVSFAIDGPDSQQWQLTYSTEGEQPGIAIFNGHTATIKGLTIGKKYLIKLTSVDELYLNGDLQVEFWASELIYPENLAITSFKDNTLTVSWYAPENSSVESWSVHCYNAAGYNENVIATDTTVIFENIDNTQNYTVEVSAAGQSVCQRTTVEENSITLDDIVTKVNTNGQLTLSWNASEEIPEGGWNVAYRIDGTEIETISNCNKNAFTIKDTLPNQTYTIEITAANGAPVVCAPVSYTTGDAKIFSCTYGGATITGSDISLSMCNTPNKKNWNRRDLKKDDYTTTFKVGGNASFVIRALKLYGISDDELIVTYAIKDEDGKLISVQNEEFTWRSLLDYYYGEINIPSLPADPGEYTVTVYFNSGFVGEQAFTVTK